MTLMKLAENCSKRFKYAKDVLRKQQRTRRQRVGIYKQTFLETSSKTRIKLCIEQPQQEGPLKLILEEESKIKRFEKVNDCKTKFHI